MAAQNTFVQKGCLQYHKCALPCKSVPKLMFISDALGCLAITLGKFYLLLEIDKTFGREKEKRDMRHLQIYILGY